MQCKYCETSIPIQGVHYSSVGIASCQKISKMPKQTAYISEKQPPVTFDQLKPGDYFRWEWDKSERMMKIEAIKTEQQGVVANAVNLDTGVTTVVFHSAVVDTSPVVSM